MRTFFAVAVSFALQTAAHAQPAPLEFKGLRLGAKTDEIAALARYTCQPLRGVLSDDQCVLRRGEKETVAGTTARDIRLFILGGELHGVSIKINAAAYPRVRDAMRERYGEASGRRTEPLQTGVGRLVENEISTWRFGEHMIELEKYYGDVETSEVFFRTQHSQQEFRRRHAEEIKANARDF
jgi:hypothetical protein